MARFMGVKEPVRASGFLLKLLWSCTVKCYNTCYNKFLQYCTFFSWYIGVFKAVRMTVKKTQDSSICHFITPLCYNACYSAYALKHHFWCQFLTQLRRRAHLRFLEACNRNKTNYTTKKASIHQLVHE